MEESPTKSTSVKKVTPLPVESTINQRPRRKIKHKFIKCNRDSPEKLSTETEANIETAAAVPTDSDIWDASTSQTTIPKTKSQSKCSSKKNARLSGRQNRRKNSVPDIEDSNLQMVEIIDDPSDDPNVSIEEIIETCVLDAEEYQRMITSSKQASNDSSSNTTTSVTDQSDGHATPTDKANSTLCKQNTCDRQISVGLVDCMKDKSMFKHWTDERKVDDKKEPNTFEGVFDKSIDEVKEKVDIKPSTEFSSPIRTRRVTRLSMRRPTDTKLSSPLHQSLKGKIEGEQTTATTTVVESQTTVEKIDNSTELEEAIIKVESSGDSSPIKSENTDTILPVPISADTTAIQVNISEMSNENSVEPVNATEVQIDPSEVFSELEVKTIKGYDTMTDVKLEDTQCEVKVTQNELHPVLTEELEVTSTETVKITPKRECNDRLIDVEKAKQKVKLKKQRKRNSEKHNVQCANVEEQPQTTANDLQTAVPENQSTEQNKNDFIDYMEQKFRDSDSSKQMQQSIADESECIRKLDPSTETVKSDKKKKNKESHSDKSKRTSDSSKKSEKSFDSSSTHKSSSSKSSSSEKRSKDSKDLQTKKSHKRDNSCNRSEKEIAMDQLKALEQKTSKINKSTSNSHHIHKESSEKPRDASVKPKNKSTPDATKSKSKTKEMLSNDQKDEKSSSSKVLLDQGSSNRKSQQQTTLTNRPSKSNRSGTDVILSECYLPKQVKYDESLYSIEALKAAQAAQEEQMKADAEVARKAKEILAAKEEQAKAARTAARLAKQEEAKALEREKERAKAEAEKAAKLAKAAAKAARAKQIKENANRSNDSPRIESFGLFAVRKADSEEPQISSPVDVKPGETLNQDFIPENFKNSPAFAQFQSLGPVQNENQVNEIVTKSEVTAIPADEEETNIRRSGRIKTITETKQRACGFGLVKDKFHSMYVGDLSYSSMSDSQYNSDYNSSNSNSMLDLSEIERDLEMEPVVVKREKTAEELEAEKADVAAGLSLFKQIIDCEYRSERTISKETKKMTCDCFLTKSEIERGELGCGEDCLNRLIFIECGSRCAVGDRCTNKRFQKHQNSDCSIFKAGKKGFGMKAASVIEAGDFIMEYVGEVLNSKQFDERRFKYSNDNIQHHYFMALRSDCVIDATIKGNISRFINHSCDPNAETQKWTVNGELRIGFFSTRTIQPDEEITFDYQFQRYGKEAQKCYCEAENCRGWIGEEPDSEEEEDDEEEAEDEEESEEEADQIEENDVTPIASEIIKTDIAAIDPADVSQDDTLNDTLNEKPIVPSTTPSPTKKIRKAKLDQKPKKFKIKKSEIMEDPDLDHEIANLMKTNLKNQAHTLRFSRLMVRAKMLDARSKLLCILRNGDRPCRRLFLDYNGLKLLHAWMCNPVTNNVHQEWTFRLDILETLDALPIPNKNMLQDSKVLVIVRKWADTKSIKESVKSPQESPSDSGSGTPILDSADVNSSPVEDARNVDVVNAETVEQSKLGDGLIDSSKEVVISSPDAVEATESLKEIADSPIQIPDSSKETADSPKENADCSKVVVDHSKEITESSAVDSCQAVTELSKEITDALKPSDSLKEENKAQIQMAVNSDDINNSVTEQIQQKIGEECADDELMEEIRYLAAKLLESWEQLKEDFRIPKKLRIEQMKEHEQEANRSYRAFGITDSEDSNKRYGDPSKVKDKDRFKKEIRNRPKESNDPESVFLKVQRRRLFEAQQAEASINKRNYERQVEAIHVAKCKYFQLDPRITSYRDIPFSVSPLTGQWYSKDGEMIATPPSHAHIKPPQELPTNPDEYDLPPMELPPQWKFAIDSKGRLYYYHVKIRIPQWDPPIKILPLREEQAPIDEVKTEACDDNEVNGKDESIISQSICNEVDSDKDDDSEESSDAVDSSEDELMQKRQQLLNSVQVNQTDLDISANLAVEISAMATTSDKGAMDDSTDQSFNLDSSLLHSSGKKKNRDGLATERLISPRTDEERLQSKIEMQRYKANKEKLRRRRENAKLRQHGSSEPSRKLKKLTEGLPVVSQQEEEIEETDDEDEVNASDFEVGVLNAKFVDELDGIKSDKISNRPDQQKVRLEAIRSNRKAPKRKRNEPEPVPHNSNEVAKRIKEKFCAEMSGVIVQHLGPYRKDDCRVGRITNNDDFKHLARKLTHFVMLKELKHCDNTVTVLEVTDSVRAKSKEFIRKYMAKFGDVYVKPENEPEYKEFCNT